LFVVIALIRGAVGLAFVSPNASRPWPRGMTQSEVEAVHPYSRSGEARAQPTASKDGQLCSVGVICSMVSILRFTGAAGSHTFHGLPIEPVVEVQGFVCAAAGGISRPRCSWGKKSEPLPVQLNKRLEVTSPTNTQTPQATQPFKGFQGPGSGV
jgi:hypothetical protein